MSAAWTSSSLFYRQVNPSHRTDGVPNSQAFNPFPKDKDQLSVDDADKVSAADAWAHFTRKLGFQSAGTWAVTLGEVIKLPGLGLEASPVLNVLDESKNNGAHCHIDFSKVSSKGQKRRYAQSLAILATARGCLYEGCE